MTVGTLIKNIANELSKNIGIITKLKHVVPFHTLKILYSSLILPHFTHGILACGNKTDKLLKIQKRTVRTITLNKYNAHTEPLFKRLEILKILDLCKFNILKFYYSCGLSTTTIEYSCPSACLCVFVSACLSVCVCVSVYLITKKIMVQST